MTTKLEISLFGTTYTQARMHAQDSINARCRERFVAKLRNIGFNDQLTKVLPSGLIARWTVGDVFGNLDIVDNLGRCRYAATVRIN